MAREVIKRETSASVSPLVFISHDTRDAALATAFAELVADVSGGTLKSFRSSDNRGDSGIEFGAIWYPAILSKLDEAIDVVVLLTTRSMDRPWIHYEAGVAAGKLGKRVIGIALGIPLARATTGPFGQFQNSTDEEDSITKLMMQLLQQSPVAAPREEFVRKQVQLFRKKVQKALATLGDVGDAAKSYGVRVGRLKSRITTSVTLTGSLRRTLPRDIELWLFVQGTSTEYWAHAEMTVRPDKTWSVDYDTGPLTLPTKRKFLFCLVGAEGRKLITCYQTINRRHRAAVTDRKLDYYPIPQLTSDIVEACDKLTVEFKPPKAKKLTI